MKTLNYSITIDKPVDFVFQKICDKESYPNWAKAWGEGMTFEGSWSEGESFAFFDRSGSGTKARIEKLVPNECIKMVHVAMVQDSKDLEEMDDAMKKWVGAKEEYYFTEENGKTHLEIVIIADEAFEPMMQAWNQALVYFKEICEK